MSESQTAADDNRKHLVYWNAAKCARCGYTVRNKGRGKADSRKDCPEADNSLLTQRHDFAHGERSSLTTWNDQREPTAEEILNLTDDQWRQVVGHE